ncbi:MAG: hypothetical protein AAB337_00200 [Patescibacteria group bacterium]
MTKFRLFNLIALAVLIIAPFWSRADAGVSVLSEDNSDITVYDSWEYGDYRVEAVSDFVPDPSSAWDLLLVLQFGLFPSSFDLQTNDDRAVYAQINSDDTLDVNELNLEELTQTALVNDANVLDNGVAVKDFGSAKAYVDGNFVYAVVDGALYAYHEYNNTFQSMYRENHTFSEDVLDAEDGRVLVKATFPTGEEQLWFYTYVANGPQEVADVPGSWTIAGEDILDGHFTDEGDIEFFSYFARNVSSRVNKTSTNPWQTQSYKQYVSWYRDASESTNLVQSMNNNTAWVDQTDHLYISNGTDVRFVASLGRNGTFLLQNDVLLWSDGYTGGIADMTGHVITKLNFAPTDANDNFVVGETANGKIVMQDLNSDEQTTLGSGAQPIVVGNDVIYWAGTDRLYRAVLYLPLALGVQIGEPIKLASSKSVFMLTDETLSYLPNESTYYTWYDSLDEVRTITPDEFDSYAQSADDVGIKPGTLLTIDSGKKVYMVGVDGELHWIVNEETVEALYGSDWNKEIYNYRLIQLVDYDYGNELLLGDDEWEDAIEMAIQ